ncbi:abscisic acid receptor pyl6, partial [Phtheirospermum japonicum]
ITPHNRINKCARFFFCVLLRHIHNVRFYHNRPITVRMEGGDRPVVTQAVLAADHAEAHHVLLVVQDLEPLGAARRRQAGDHAHLPETAHVAVADDDVAAPEEDLVGLRLVEASHDGPHGVHRRSDRLHRRRAALVGRQRVGVVVHDVFRHRDVAGNRADHGRFERLFLVQTGRRRGGAAGGVIYGADSMKLKRTRHFFFLISLSDFWYLKERK